MPAAAERIRAAVRQVLLEPSPRTPDLGGDATTAEVGRAVREALLATASSQPLVEHEVSYNRTVVVLDARIDRPCTADSGIDRRKRASAMARWIGSCTLDLREVAEPRGCPIA